MDIITGLEIGSSKITCFIASQNNDGNIEVLGTGVEYCEVLKRGQLINIEVAATAIEKAIEKAQLMSGEEVEEIHLSLSSRACEGIYSDGRVAVQENQGEREVGYNDIARVIEQAESSVKLPQDWVIIHTLPISFKVDKNEYEEPRGTLGHLLETEVYLITCPVNVLESFERAVEEAGYKIARLTIDMNVVGESILSPQETKIKNIIIDIGADYTSAILYENKSISKLITLDVGGKDISNDLSFALKTGFEESERIKKEYGAADPSLVSDEKIRIELASYKKYSEVSSKGISQIIGARLEEIFQLVRKELLNEQPKDNSKVETSVSLSEASIVLVGGTATINGANHLAEAVFKSPARVGYCLNFSGGDENITRPEHGAMTGLIKWATQEGFQESGSSNINLMRKNKSNNRISNFFKNLFT